MSVEFSAIEVDRIDPDGISFGASRADTGPSMLPTSVVRLPLEDPSAVAVLSWRWDVLDGTRSSRNASLAIAQAARMGVRHLFMDVVSIDQGLRGDELMRAVVEFSALYSRIPVLAAYDQVGLGQREWTRIMRRPWILREARAFHANPNPIVYVGHAREQGADESLGFRHMLKRIWGSSFTHSILHVLCGQVGMYTVSDLRFIMPEHAEILSAAYEQMSRNDFLLTAAILAQVPVDDLRLNEELDLAEVDFDRYTCLPAPGLSYDTNQDLLLDGEKIATWMSHYNLYMDHYRRKLEVVPDAERRIHRALGMSEEDFQRYAARADERRQSLVLPDAVADGSLEIEVVFAG